MKLQLYLAKVFKFITYVLFVFLTLLYACVLVVVPLVVFVDAIRVFAGLGLPTVAAVALGVGALGYIVYLLSRMPELYKLVVDIGFELARFGQAQTGRYDVLIEQAQAKGAN